MIASLHGKLIHKSPGQVILNVNGIGYRVHVPLTTFYQLPGLEEEVFLNIHTHVREDCIHLYGFLTQLEKEMFLRLIEVSGIGPRLAVNILSGISAEELRAAIWAGDVNRLNSIKGVGRKTAERMVVELRDKLESEAASYEGLAPEGKVPQQVVQDALSALVNLGYTRKDAQRAVRRVLERGPEDSPDLEYLIRNALKILAGEVA